MEHYQNLQQKSVKVNDLSSVQYSVDKNKRFKLQC